LGYASHVFVQFFIFIQITLIKKNIEIQPFHQEKVIPAIMKKKKSPVMRRTNLVIKKSSLKSGRIILAIRRKSVAIRKLTLLSEDFNSTMVK